MSERQDVSKIPLLAAGLVGAVTWALVAGAPSASAVPHCGTTGGSCYTTQTEKIDGKTYTVYAINGSEADDSAAVDAALSAAKTANTPSVIDFPVGTYDFVYAAAKNETYYITNSATSTEVPDGAHKVGIVIKDMNDVILRGHNSTLRFHGVITALAIDHSSNVKLQDLNLDYARPVVSEMQVKAVGSDYIDYVVQADSLYAVSNGTLNWIGESGDNFVPSGFSSVSQIQEYDPTNSTVWRDNSKNPFANGTVADQGSNVIRVTYSGAKPAMTVGHTIQMRNDARKEVLAFIWRSKNVSWSHVQAYASPSLGMVCQHTDTMSIDHLWFAPKPGSTRTNASMADFLHFMGCKGEVSVTNSTFSGAQDDAMNVHGTYLKVVGKPAANRITVQFQHNQSWGFDAYRVGDKLDFVKMGEMVTIASATVSAVIRIDDKNITLTLDAAVPTAVVMNSTAVENITWTPYVTFTGNTISAIPTRGILVTTRRGATISGNTFNRTPMPAILIEGDSQDWWESGKAANYDITGNTFNFVAGLLQVSPSAPGTDPAKIVHHNINFSNNTVRASGNSSINVRALNGLTVSGNTFSGGGLNIRFSGSQRLVAGANMFLSRTASKAVSIDHGYIGDDRVDSAFTVTRTNAITRPSKRDTQSSSRMCSQKAVDFLSSHAADKCGRDTSGGVRSP